VYAGHVSHALSALQHGVHWRLAVWWVDPCWASRPEEWSPQRRNSRRTGCGGNSHHCDRSALDSDARSSRSRQHQRGFSGHLLRGLGRLVAGPPAVRHGGHARVRSNWRADDHRFGVADTASRSTSASGGVDATGARHARGTRCVSYSTVATTSGPNTTARSSSPLRAGHPHRRCLNGRTAGERHADPGQR
jgi:hypothetical protein